MQRAAAGPLEREVVDCVQSGTTPRRCAPGSDGLRARPKRRRRKDRPAGAGRQTAGPPCAARSSRSRSPNAR